MADISISLSNIQNIKTVNIEGLGVFRVRKLGAGEELDLSIKMRRLMTILTTLQRIDIQSFDSITDEGKSRLAKQEKHIDKLSNEITDIKRFELNTYKQCFSSDEDGAVDSLINGLSDEERTELFNQIFGAKKYIDTPELVKPDETKDSDESK